MPSFLSGTGFGEECTSNYKVFPMEKGDFFSDCFFKWFSGKLSEECGYLLFKSDPGVPGRSGEEPLQA